jgi:hypothetical protein
MSDAGVRFVCWVTPRDVVRSQAIELGWDPNSSESPSEYVEPTACEREYTFNSLDAALEFGRAFVAELNDWWGQVVVYREVRHKDQVYDPLEWKPEHKWLITDAGITHDEPVNDIGE